MTFLSVRVIPLIQLINGRRGQIIILQVLWCFYQPSTKVDLIGALMQGVPAIFGTEKISVVINNKPKKVNEHKTVRGKIGNS